MDPQATGGTDGGTAVLEQEDAQFEADMLKGFADEETSEQSTTLPTEKEGDSANPDKQTLESSGVEVVDEAETDTAAQTATETEAVEEAVDNLESALKRIGALEEVGKKSADTLGGRLGAIEQALKALSGNTKVKASVRAKLEKFGTFGEDYPEFAKAQVDFINGILDELEMPGISPEFTQGLIKDASTAAEAAAETAAERKINARLAKQCRDDLDETHPGWQEVVGLPDKDLDQGGVIPDTAYRRWLATQSKEYQEKITGHFSPVVIGKSIDKFREWEKSQKKPATTTTTAQPSTSTRTQRLHTAAAPRVSGTTKPAKRTLSVDEAMDLSFRGKL